MPRGQYVRIVGTVEDRMTGSEQQHTTTSSRSTVEKESALSLRLCVVDFWAQ